ncbi:hypothetical protein A7K94_0208060 [Modestobacter sp. VKM Ac-2676]|nr:hypothetical protein A7K94_0208060 [Modestobacter sp. VKM Ac-2676]
MNKRTLTVGCLTAGLSAGLVAGAVSPAAAQGNPVGGAGNTYHLSGALNDDGLAQAVFTFGDAGDEVYFGDWYGGDIDLPLVRRGNEFHVPDVEDPSATAAVFSYGDAGDTVLVGDWDGDGVDSLAVRRGNRFLVKNDNQVSGNADTEFSYGDEGDTVLVGNWNGELGTGKGDTLMVQRGNTFYVKNDLQTGVAEYTVQFGDPGDRVLVGDWATITDNGDGTETIDSGDQADQLAVRRGYTYYLSAELADAAARKVNPATMRVFGYGDPGDTVFVASLPTPLDADGQYTEGDVDALILGDGLGVRRSE